jgi:rhomboid protease GluP
VARLPTSIHGYSALGVIYAKMGRMAEAIRANQRVLDLAPDNLATHRNLALLYRTTGQMPQALIHARRALALAPPEQRQALEKFISRLRQ